MEKVGPQTLNLDLDFLARNRQQNPDDWGTSQPHNTYSETPWYQKAVIRPQTRLDSKILTSEAVLHESIKLAPLQLNDPSHMITLDTLKQTFGSTWSPRSPALNAFEQKCKDNWKEEVCHFSTHVSLCLRLLIYHSEV